MISSQVVAGPKNGDEPTVAGTSIQWVLANDGTVAWPEATTLRLVAGPALLPPVIGVPTVARGQTVIIDLEVSNTEEPAEVAYALVTPCGQPFGELATLSVVPKPAPAPPKPVAAVLTTPMDGLDKGIEALQGELKTVEWTLANIGQAKWPEDACMQLFYNTPGFAHLPAKLGLPAADAGLTVQAGVTCLMPEAEGVFKAMWAVTSESQPEFGEVLYVEFNVSEFPFMEWMLAEELRADTASESQESQAIEEPPAGKLSVAVATQEHRFVQGEVGYENIEESEGLVSLGRVSGLEPGMPWVLELVLANDGEVPWPANAEIKCCFGDSLGCGCSTLSSEAVPVGAAVMVRMELVAPQAPCQAAWVVASDDAVLGPVMMLEVQ